MLAVQKMISENGIESLESLGISTGEYDDIYVLNYDQISSPKFHPVVRECRGLILDKKTLKVLCRSFDRFFNYGEDPDSESFDIQNSVVFEKVDGSLLRFWHSEKTGWNAATRQMAYAEGNTSSGRTFADVVYDAIGTNDLNRFMKGCNTTLTYTCELVSGETRVVKSYGIPALYALAVRNNDTGEYKSDEFCELFAMEKEIRIPKKYSFYSIQNCLESMKYLEEQDEGYVARVGDFRLKIKNPSYLALASLRNNGCLSRSKILRLIMSGESSEYLSVFPEDKYLFDPVEEKLDALCGKLVDEYDLVKDTVDQKDFAIAVKNSTTAPFLFTMRKEGIDGEQMMFKMANRVADNDGSAIQLMLRLLDRM